MNGQMMIPQSIVPGMPGMMDKPPGAAPYMGYFPPIPQMPPIPQATTTTTSTSTFDFNLIF